jgi:hypothetical protein
MGLDSTVKVVLQKLSPRWGGEKCRINRGPKLAVGFREDVMFEEAPIVLS